MTRHVRFLAKTVLIQDNKVTEGLKVLNRIMGKEGLFDLYRRNQYYEKPFMARRRINYERSKAIYDEDMDRKVKFLMRKNRIDPWIGSI